MKRDGTNKNKIDDSGVSQRMICYSVTSSATTIGAWNIIPDPVICSWTGSNINF